jgi:4,5-DOPA dioxygenase extradiol
MTMVIHWAEEFSSFVTSSIEKFDFDAVLKYKNNRQIASLSVPTEEHFDPLFYVLGATLAKTTKSESLMTPAN